MLPLNLFLRAYLFYLVWLPQLLLTGWSMFCGCLTDLATSHSYRYCIETGFTLIIEPFDDRTPTIPNPILHFRWAFALETKLINGFFITIRLGGFEEYLPMHYMYWPNKIYRFWLAKGNVITVNSFWDGHLGDLQYVSVLERCPSYRESNKGSKERQGPTLSVRLIEVPFKRE